MAEKQFLTVGNKTFVGADHAKLNALLKERIAGTRLTLSASGWVAPLDANLAQEAELGRSAIDTLRQGLTPRWADALLAEVKGRFETLVGDRRYFRDVNARLATLLIAQVELDGIEAIHNDETAAGWYTYTAESSAEDVASQQAWSASLQNVSAVYTTLLGDTQIQEFVDEPQRTALFQAAIAEASFKSPYTKVHDEALKYPPGSGKPEALNYLVVEDLNEFPLNPNTSPSLPKIFELQEGQIPPGSPLSFSATAFMGTWRSSVMQQMTYTAGLKTQSVASSGAAAAAQHTLQSKQALANWDANDVSFRRRRTQLALDTNAFRKSAQTAADGPHNYVRELTALRTNFVSRLADLYARLETIRDGLAVYWSLTSLPALPFPGTWDDTAGPYLDALAQWMIQLGRAAQSIALSETSSVVTISLRRTLGDKAWKAAISTASSAKPFVATFALPSSVWKSMRSVRVRGISAAVVGPNDADAGVWSLRASLPSNAIVVTANGAASSVTQSLPAVGLGRVQTRQSNKAPDVMAMSIWKNASPCCDGSDANAFWQVEVDFLSSNGEEVSKLTDVQLDLIIAAAAI